MPSKNRIAGYPPDHILKAFHDFKDKEGLTESKALIRVLSGYFGVAENVAQEVSTPFATVEQLQKTEQELSELRKFMSESKSSLLTDLQAKVDEIDLVVKEIQKNQSLAQTLTTGELARRLNMPDSSLSHWKSDDPRRGKSPEELLEATRAKDPEGIGWILIKEINKFKPERPINSSKTELQGELLPSSSVIT
jgi:hypothetical protein